MEGEGRNAIFAAENQWEVYAYDFSKVARDKALKYAENKGVQVIYELHDNNDLMAKPCFFDVIALIFTHLPTQQRPIVFENWLTQLKKGGKLLMEVYSKDQIYFGTGGPSQEDLLYTVEELKELLKSLKQIDIFAQQVFIDEGSGHRGNSSVIRVVAEK